MSPVDTEKLVIFEQRCLSKKSKMFSKEIGRQRQRELIKNQPFTQLNSTTMEMISGSNYGSKSLLLGEIIVFCYWLQRSILCSENRCFITVPNRIFDAKYVVAQDQFFSQLVHTIIGSFGVTLNFIISKTEYRQKSLSRRHCNFLWR